LEYVLKIDGIAERQVVLETGGFFSRSQLLLDNETAPRAGTPNNYLLTLDDGREVSAQLRSNLLDPVPTVIVDGKPIHVVEGFTLFQQMLASLSFLIALFMSIAGLMTFIRQVHPKGEIQLMGYLSMAINMLLGVLLGFISMIINRRILRSDMARSSQIFSIGAITIIVVIGFLVVFILLVGILSVFSDLVSSHP
jgi:hypothetical protein